MIDCLNSNYDVVVEILLINYGDNININIKYEENDESCGEIKKEVECKVQSNTWFKQYEV